MNISALRCAFKEFPIKVLETLCVMPNDSIPVIKSFLEADALHRPLKKLLDAGWITVFEQGNQDR